MEEQGERGEEDELVVLEKGPPETLRYSRVRSCGRGVAVGPCAAPARASVGLGGPAEGRQVARAGPGCAGERGGRRERVPGASLEGGDSAGPGGRRARPAFLRLPAVPRNSGPGGL